MPLAWCRTVAGDSSPTITNGGSTTTVKPWARSLVSSSVRPADRTAADGGAAATTGAARPVIRHASTSGDLVMVSRQHDAAIDGMHTARAARLVAKP